MQRNSAKLNRSSSREPKALFQRNKEELEDYWLSEHSQFKDVRWEFTPTTPGLKKTASTINWSIELFDGSKLTDPHHAARLHWSKTLLLTLLKMPAEGVPTMVGGVSAHQQSFKWLLSWMAINGYHVPSQLTAGVVSRYIDELPQFMLDCTDEEKITVSIARRALEALANLWRQRIPMAQMGIESISIDPFFRKSLASIADECAGQSVGWIKPIPDEVAVPMFNEALWFLSQPAEDILRLVAILAQHPNEGRAQRIKRMRRDLRRFEFGSGKDSSEPWHRPLAELPSDMYGESAAHRTTRMLAYDLLGACAIIVQGMSGMRISEICGLKGGIDPVSGLPSNVRLESSSRGLYEWFLVRSLLSKTKEGPPIEVDWVLGMRPEGSNEIPPAIRALQVLNRLFSLWRDHAVTDRLILQWRGHASLSHPSGTLKPILSDSLRKAMRDFIVDWVNLTALPNESRQKVSDGELIPWRESKGKIFSSHMLRKTWASFTLAANPSLLGAIQMQFHHLNMAVTEGGYIGNNPLQVEALDSVSRQRRNLLIYEMATGDSIAAGRMAQTLGDSIAEFKDDLGELPTSERWRIVDEWADNQELQFFFTEYATCCPVKTSEMRCHEISNTSLWFRRYPNFATRDSSVCAGCACAIIDKSHIAFWSERFTKSQIAIREAEAVGKMNGFRVILERAEQAKKILRKLGVNVSEL